MEDIQRIRREHGLDLNTTDEQAERAVASLRSNLSNSLRNLSEELYTKDLHFVLEFIQNADDNDYATGVSPTLEFKLEGRLITIRCNEKGFTADNVQAICSVGKSTKKNLEGYIGEKGIGFKAVFTIANVVHVLSGDYAFKFDNSGSEELGMIAPIWTEEYPVESNWTTFRLSIPSRVDLNNLSEKLAAVEPTLLLFLRKLRQLDLVVNGRPRHLSRTDLPNGITVLRSNSEENRYVMVRHLVTGLPPDAKRPNVTTSEVILAFPVSSSGMPIIIDQDVHTFLPLRSFGFSFIIQADFLSTANREDILSNRPWNSTLRDAIPTAFLEALVQFSYRPELRYNWPQYVPRHVSEDFMKPIVNGIKQGVRLRGVDGKSYPPTSLIIVPREYQTESSEPLVPENFMGSLRYLDSGYNSTRDAGVLAHLGVKTMSADDFISGLSNMGQQVRTQNNTWLERTCSALRSLANEWRSPHKDRIQNLRLVPLESGTWDTARSSDVFFVDASASDVPDDLPMRFVRRYPSLGQEHRRLLEDLGVKVATAAEIAKQVLALHRRYTPNAATVLTHAKFIFHHTPYTIAKLKVRCNDDEVRDAASVYMDFPFVPNKVPLSEILEPHGAHFLHHEYYTAFPAGSDDGNRWFQWLRDILEVSVSPYFDGDDFCDEFWEFAANSSSSILRVLRDYWPLLEPELSTSRATDALKRLSAIQVICSDDQLHRLDETYLGRSALRSRFPDLLFVNVKDVESPLWDFLVILGVTLNVSCMFYLKRLIECSQGKHIVTSAEVFELYEQISSRFNDEGKQDRIRQAFRDHKLIYIPSPASDGQSAANVATRWLSREDIFWTGPRSVFSKPVLTSLALFAPLHKLFAEQLRISSCPDDILVHELRVAQRRFGRRALTPDEHRMVFNILKDIDQAIPSRKGSKTPDWLRDLKALAAFPATASTNEIRLYPQGQVYNPIGSGRLLDLFSGRIPILVAPGDERLGRLKTLLSSDACSDIRTLRDEVKKEIKHGADREGVDVPLSKRYRSLLDVLQRIVLWKHRSFPDIADWTDLIVWEVKELFCQYTLGDITTNVEPQAVAIESDNGGKRLVVWRCRSGQDRGDDLEFAVAFANEWKIDVEGVYMAVSASPDVYLALHDIPSLASLQRPSEYSPTVLSIGISGVESKSVKTVNNTVSQVTAVYPTSPRHAGARQQPSSEVEWANLVRDCDAEVHRVAQAGVLSSSVHSLEGLFGNLSIQRSSRAFSSSSELHHTGSLDDATLPRIISQAPLGGDPPFADIPVPPQHSARWDRGSSQEIPHIPRAATFMPISEDFTTGALGELWLFYLLSTNLPQFTEDNWTSELRYYASGHLFGQYTGASLADFCYEDATGALTKMLLGEDSNLAKKWSARYPRYYLEVKSTAGDQYTPFHFSRNQLRTMSVKTVRDPDSVPDDVYVLVRVWNVRRNDLKQIRCEAYLDPHKLLYTGELCIDSEDGVSVVIQK